MLDNILKTEEGPKILKSQKQKLLEDSTLLKRMQHNPHMLLKSAGKQYDEDLMSVDDAASTVLTKRSHLKVNDNTDQKVQVEARDLR